jgi:ABC-type lipoprotein release transport system permease subunit
MLIAIAVRNVLRGWRRSLIVLMTIVVGMSSCILIVAWTRGLGFQMADNAIRAQLAHLAVHARGYHKNPDLSRGFDDPEPVLRLMAEMGAHASPRLSGEGLLRTARKSARAAITGIDPVAEAGVSIIAESIVEGTFLAAAPTAGRSRLRPVVIGAEMAENLRLRLGDKVVVQVPGDAGIGAFRVTGIYRTASSTFDKVAVFARLADVQTLFERPGLLTGVAIALDDPQRISEVQAALRRELDESYEVLRWDERAPMLAMMVDGMNQVSWILYATVFVAMAFGIANTMLMAVYERMREFGVMRSLGLQRSRLIAMILIESALLTVLGTLLGVALGLGATARLAETGIDLSRFAGALESYGIGAIVHPRAEARDAMSPLLLALLTGLLAAIWPGVKAIRLSPAEALRRR